VHNFTLHSKQYEVHMQILELLKLETSRGKGWSTPSSCCQTGKFFKLCV